MDSPAARSEAALPVGQLSVAALLEAVAARTPAPGGGGAAGVTCALAAALIEMTAAFGSGPEAETAKTRAAELRAAALQLAEEDRTAYAPVLEALALPAGSPERRQRLAAARSQASEPPLGIAEAAAEVAELGVTAARAAGPHLIGDALTGVLLAQAANRAAAALVAINLRDDGDDPRQPRVKQSTSRTEEACREMSAIGKIDL
jgi:methenyltetrahydrofolate cyclohydrolase